MAIPVKKFPKHFQVHSDKIPGPICSKLTMSLVNDSLKFTSSDTQICWDFLLKTVSSFSYSHFFSKKISEYCILNPLKQLTKWPLTSSLTTLWTSGPWKQIQLFPVVPPSDAHTTQEGVSSKMAWPNIVSSFSSSADCCAGLLVTRPWPSLSVASLSSSTKFWISCSLCPRCKNIFSRRERLRFQKSEWM